MLKYLEQKLILSFSNISFSLSDRDFLHKFYAIAIATGSPILHGPQREREIICHSITRTKFTDAFQNPKYGFFSCEFSVSESTSSKAAFSLFQHSFGFFPLYQCQAERFFSGIVMYTKHIARFPYPCLSSLNRPLNASKNNNTIMCHNTRKRNVRNFQRIRKKRNDRQTDSKMLTFHPKQRTKQTITMTQWNRKKRKKHHAVDRRPFTQKHQLSFLFLCIYFYLQLCLLCLVRWIFFHTFP